MIAWYWSMSFVLFLSYFIEYSQTTATKSVCGRLQVNGLNVGQICESKGE